MVEKTDVLRLREELEKMERLVVFLHDNPDPDAIAAGWILSSIAKHLGLQTYTIYGGYLGRAENRNMVKILEIPMVPLGERDAFFKRGECYALVDTQPGSGNNSFPVEYKPHIVIDHHPKREDLDVPFCDIRPSLGACTTLLLEYYEAFELPLTPRLATASFYAIVSETQDLERDATKADREACIRLLAQVDLPVLGKIRHPKRERDYYRTIARAMRNVQVGKNTCICHIGPISTPEMVAEVADFLISMQQISWCLTTGFFEDAMTLSLRTTHPDGQAGATMKELVKNLGRGGGHGMMAGASIPLKDKRSYESICYVLTDRLLDVLPRKIPETLKPLLEEGDRTPES